MGSGEVGLPGLDRRESFRARFYADVEIDYGSSKLRGRTQDISLGGMLIEMENPLWQGAEFQARGLFGGQPALGGGGVGGGGGPKGGGGGGGRGPTAPPHPPPRLRKLIESLPH